MTDTWRSDYFRQERREVEAIIPGDAKRILDVGCGEGILGKRLLAKGAREVVGIEIMPDVCEKARENLTSVVCGDIEKNDLSFEEGHFDCMIFGDILEHLRDPLSLLKKLRIYLADSGVIVASIPNVRYYGVISMLADGHWKYGEHGILDKTHLRFFTKKEIEALFARAGFEITGITANIDSAYNSLDNPFSGEITFGKVTLKGLMPEEIRDLFVFQHIIRAQKAGYELHQVDNSVNTAIDSGNLEKAKQTIETYLELHSVDMDMLYKHAEICIKLRCIDEALKSLRKIRVFHPEREDVIKLMEAIKADGLNDVLLRDPGQQHDGDLKKKPDTEEIRKIAIVRGANLNKWEMQNYEPLMDQYDITAYTTNQHIYDRSQITLPTVQLSYQSQGLLLEMQGLEDHLADKDLVFTADITHRFSAQAIEAKKKTGGKVVCLEWENIPFNYEEYDVASSIKKMVRDNADHFIAVTERAKEALMLEGVSEDRIDVIPMGIDLHIFKPRKTETKGYRESLDISSEEIVVLFIGRMVWEKGIYDLLNAAARIIRDRALTKYAIKFLIVGKGTELKNVRERAMMLGISRHIKFVEEYPYQKMYELHSLTDLFVLPSIPLKNWQEQFGMVLIESMACSTPVISTLSGSIPEVVGEAGILVQPNDHMSLYKAIKQLIVDRELRERLGGKALLRAKKRFDARKTAEKVRAVFEKVMSQKTKKNSHREIYIKGIKSWKEGEKDKGFEMVCKTFEEDPDRRDVANSIIEMGMELKEYEIVEKSLREYLTYHPANLDVLTSLAETLLHLDKIDQAQEEIRKVFIFESDNEEAAIVLDKINEKMNALINERHAYCKDQK